MENAVKGQIYFITEYGAKIQGRQFYSLYRAKYLGREIGFTKYVILTNINWIGEKRIDKGVCMLSPCKIVKMESLKDITNEMLPSNVLMKIDEYL
jgi:hypothetical protein